MCAIHQEPPVYVYFSTSLGSLSSASGTTNSSGRARTYLTSTSAGYAGVSATTAGGRGDTTVVTCFAVSITSPSSFPAYAGVNSPLSLSAQAAPAISGSYSWSKVSGPGDVVFSSPNSAATNFSSDTPGIYKVKCEFLASGAGASYTVESGEIWVVKVEFFEHGTTNTISEAHVGTDGNSTTNKDGETKEIDIKITPNNVTLDFSMDNAQTQITPTGGNGTTTATITGIGDGSADSELKVKKDDVEFEALPVRIHKPDRVFEAGITALDTPENYIGKGNVYHYDAIVQFHSSFYIMDIYLKNSTYRHAWVPIIEGDLIIDLNISRELLNDSQKVTEADDDID